MTYDITVNKKFNYIKLFTIKKSVKGGQNKVSKIISSLVDKYVLKKNATGEGRL